MTSVRLRWAVLAVAAVAVLHPAATPPMALAAGLVLGLLGLNPDAPRVTRWTGQTMRGSIVLLGFGLSVGEVVRAGASGLLVSAGTIALTVAAGLWLGRRLGVADDASMLVCGGTAICGGSAIAALAPALGARSEATGIALAVVFVLNGIALFLFPPLGHALGMTASQFGAWAALAIHDTSSVVGAAAAFSPEAVPSATVLKLTRALWIVPLVVVLTAVRRRRDPSAGPRVPWRKAVPGFIVLFVLASAVRAVVPLDAAVFEALEAAGRRGLVVSLLGVGTGLTVATLRTVGARPLVQAVLLWAFATAVALALVRAGAVG